jgi:hypothetical protein
MENGEAFAKVLPFGVWEVQSPHPGPPKAEGEALAVLPRMLVSCQIRHTLSGCGGIRKCESPPKPSPHADSMNSTILDWWDAPNPMRLTPGKLSGDSEPARPRDNWV